MDISGFAQLWVLLALASAFFHASRLAVTKHLSPRLSAEVLTLYVNVTSLALTLPLIVRYHDFPLDDPRYLGAVAAGAVLSGGGGWALNAALHRTEVSLVGPAMTLTPGFAVVIEWLIAGDAPGPIGLVGVGLLVAGAYVLSLGDGTGPWYLPFKRLLLDPGCVLATVAAACFAGASVFGRIGIGLSDPLSFSVLVAIVNPAVLWVAFRLRDRDFNARLRDPELTRQVGPLLLLGLLFALMRIADQLALSLALASYVMAVKRTAGAFSVLLGHWLFREPYPTAKLAGSLVMLIGVAALTL